MSDNSWLVDWRKVLALALFAAAMAGAYWIVYGLADAFPSVFMGIGIAVIPLFIGLAIWDRLRRRRAREPGPSAPEAHRLED